MQHIREESEVSNLVAMSYMPNNDQHSMAKILAGVVWLLLAFILWMVSSIAVLVVYFWERYVRLGGRWHDLLIAV